MDHCITTLYADLAVALLSICAALDRKGVISMAEMSASLQQQLAAMKASGKPLSPTASELLAALATTLTRPHP